jgi:hypothetical protein
MTEKNKTARTSRAVSPKKVLSNPEKEDGGTSCAVPAAVLIRSFV